MKVILYEHIKAIKEKETLKDKDSSLVGNDANISDDWGAVDDFKEF